MLLFYLNSDLAETLKMPSRMSMAQSRHREKFGGRREEGEKKKGFLPSSTEARARGGEEIWREGPRGGKTRERGGMTICLLVNSTWNARIAPLISRREKGKKKSPKRMVKHLSFFSRTFFWGNRQEVVHLFLAEANFRPLIMV